MVRVFNEGLECNEEKEGWKEEGREGGKERQLWLEERRKRAPRAGAGDETEEKTCSEEGGRSTLLALDLVPVHGGGASHWWIVHGLSRYPAFSVPVGHWCGPAREGR